MPDKFDTSEIRNPKRTLVRREKEAGLVEDDTPDTKQGIDKGDIPGPNMDFFKPRDKSKDAKGLAEALKKRGY